MSKKQKAPRKGVTAAITIGQPKDTRQPLLLDPVTGEDAITLLNQTIQQALGSAQMQVVIRNLLKGRRLVLNSIGKPEPDLPWGIRVKGLNLGELWLIPQRAEDELKSETGTDDAKVKTSAAPAAGSVIGKPEENERLAEAANGHAEKAKVEAAKVVAKDSA